MDGKLESRIKILERKVEGLEDEVYKGGVMEKICKNCKQWAVTNKFIDRKFSHLDGKCGYCDRVQDTYYGKATDIILIGYCEDDLLFGENFGCIHFEAKEPEYNIPS